jgi:hypothetical protein
MRANAIFINLNHYERLQGLAAVSFSAVCFCEFWFFSTFLSLFSATVDCSIQHSPTDAQEVFLCLAHELAHLG